MKAPIFPPLDTPLPALDWHARARMYRDQAIGMPDIGHYSAGPAIARDHCLCSLLQHKPKTPSCQLLIHRHIRCSLRLCEQAADWARRREIPARP